MKNETKRCAIYARISPKPEGAVGDNYSIASQLHEMKALAKRDFGCSQPIEYIDRNISGKGLDRPALEALRDAIAAKHYEVVIAYCPDRLSRNVVDSLLLMGEWTRGGARQVFVSGSYEDTPEGELAFSMQAVVAQYERKKIAERTKRGRRQKMRDGFILAQKSSYGYQYCGHKMKSRGEFRIIEAEAAIVRQIFQWVIDGWASERIATTLNERGVPTKQAGRKTVKPPRWSARMISKMIRKTKYYGEIKSGDIVVQCPAIVTREIWDAAQAAIERHKIGRCGRPSTEKRSWLLTGMVWCLKCGHRGKTQTAPEGRGVYRCGHEQRHPYKRLCPACGIGKRRLEAAVWDNLWDLISDEDLLLREMESYHGRMHERTKSQSADPAVARIEKARKRLAHAERVLRDPDQPIPYEQAKADVEQARLELVKAEMSRPAHVLQMPPRSDIRAWCAQFKRGRDLRDFKDRREVLKRIVKEIRFAGQDVAIMISVALKNWDHRVADGPNNGTPETAYSFVITRRVA